MNPSHAANKAPRSETLSLNVFVRDVLISDGMREKLTSPSTHFF
jgi:hypothetical protein